MNEICSWSTFRVLESWASELEPDDANPDDGPTFSPDAEGVVLEIAWNDLCDDITQAMDEIDPDGWATWYVSVAGFGWQHLDGYKFFTAGDGREMLRQVLPATECAFTVYRDGDAMKINNAHHDVPCGGEWYTIVPARIAEAWGIECEW